MSRKGITANVLKWIAVITMIIDHYALAIYAHTPGFVYEYYRLMRYIGRIAFPIYCFLLVEGFFYTSNRKQYILRCFFWGILSEIPFDMATRGSVINLQAQNVFFTLTTGLCTMYGLERLKGMGNVPLVLKASVSIEQFQMILSVACIALGAGLAQILEIDYHYMGVLLIVLLYYCKNCTPFIRSLVGALAFAFEKTAPIAFIPIYFYNGERGRQNKYFFYLIYPIHLAVFGCIRYFYL